MCIKKANALYITLPGSRVGLLSVAIANKYKDIARAF